jgi:hypothetical protein
MNGFETSPMRTEKPLPGGRLPMMKRTLVLIVLLTFFSPFVAAQARFEIVTEVKTVNSDVLTIQVAPTQFIPIEVTGLDLTDIAEGSVVKMEGILPLGGPVATEVELLGLNEEVIPELTGTIEKTVNTTVGEDILREVTLYGGWVIRVDGSAELKDLEGFPLELCNDPADSPDDSCSGNVFKPGNFVRAEGVISQEIGEEGLFIASEMKIVEDWPCPTGAKHMHHHVFEEDYYADDEEYCLQPQKNTGGLLTGRARIKNTDYDDLVGVLDATITIGKYVKDERHGLWITLSDAGTVRFKCFYNQGDLVDGDEACFE